MGDARSEKVSDVLMRVSKMEVFKKLNEGDPLKMGEHIGISEQKAKEDNEIIQNICLYCDLFFTKYLDPKTLEPKAAVT